MPADIDRTTPLHSKSDEYPLNSERNVLSTELTDMKNPECYDPDFPSTNHISSETSDINNGTGNDDFDGGQQWTQVGRSNSGRRSQRKKVKNQPHESIHNQVPRIGTARGPISAGPHLTRRGFSFRDTDHLVNGHASRSETDETEFTRSETTFKQDISGSDMYHSVSSSVSSDLQSTVGVHEDKQPIRFQGRYHRGRSSFRYANEDARGTGNNFFGAPHNSGFRPSYGRGIRQPNPSQTASPGSTQSPWKGPNYSMPFPSRNPPPNGTGYRPQVSAFRTRTTLPRFKTDDHPAVVTTSDTSSTSTTSPPLPTAEPAVVSENGTQKKATWAATVAAAAKPEPMLYRPTSVTCRDSPDLSITTFLRTQWRLFCEQIQQT